MKNKQVIISSVFIITILVGISFAAADINSTDSIKNWTSVCSKISDLVSQKIQAFDDGKVRRVNAYNNTESMIQNLISKLNGKGADTTQAEADNQVLQAKISQFSVDYSLFITKLESLKNYTCGNSSGAYASQLKDAKSMLPVLRNDSVQIREAVMKVKLDIVLSRNNLLVSKLGEKANLTQANYLRRISQIENRTGRVIPSVRDGAGRIINISRK